MDDMGSQRETSEHSFWLDNFLLLCPIALLLLLGSMAAIMALGG